MDFCAGHASRESDIYKLFVETFSASEGPDEGAIIGDLVQGLMKTTPSKDLFVWSAYRDDELVGCIFFSRLTFKRDARTVFIMSPVAVKTGRQRSGVGQGLIVRGLADLRQRGVDFVTTYGDPNYYSKTGFRQITEEFAQAPLTLSFPQGWLGQSLLSTGMEAGTDDRPLIGASECVPALNKQELW